MTDDTLEAQARELTAACMAHGSSGGVACVACITSWARRLVAGTKDFPIQSSGRYGRPHPTRVPWSIADKAYSVYSARYGRGQSLERLGERGGFGPEEMDEFCPGWIEESSEVVKLRRLVAGSRAGALREAVALMEQWAGDHRTIRKRLAALAAEAEPGAQGKENKS